MASSGVVIFPAGRLFSISLAPAVAENASVIERTHVDIRPFHDADAVAATNLFRLLVPDFVLTPPALLQWMQTMPDEAHPRFWVAETAGEVVGSAEAFLNWRTQESGIASLWSGVLPHARRQGIGSRLYDLAETHFRAHGARRIETSVVDEDGRRFAERRGFVHSRTERFSALDPRTVDLSELRRLAEEKAEEGFRLATLREVLHEQRELYTLWQEAAADMPRDDPTQPQPYEEWRERVLGNPLLDLDASAVVLAGERPASFAWLAVDPEGRRAAHTLTGTARAFRGHNLARLAKLAGIARCAEHGIDLLVTSNDSANAAMLAINTRLGYRPTIEHLTMTRGL